MSESGTIKGRVSNELTVQEILNSVFDAASGKLRTTTTSSEPLNGPTEYSEHQIWNAVFDGTAIKVG